MARAITTTGGSGSLPAPEMSDQASIYSGSE
ncbi:hypothetical protein VTH06DRAFT_7605 [Thermothelomyces fergusii]